MDMFPKLSKSIKSKGWKEVKHWNRLIVDVERLMYPKVNFGIGSHCNVMELESMPFCSPGGWLEYNLAAIETGFYSGYGNNASAISFKTYEKCSAAG